MSLTSPSPLKFSAKTRLRQTDSLASQLVPDYHWLQDSLATHASRLESCNSLLDSCATTSTPINRCEGRKDVWLRLERKPTSGSDLALGKGRTPANDMVNINLRIYFTNPYLVFSLKGSLAAVESELIDEKKYKLDNDQVFPNSPSTLGDLSHFLRVIIAEITEYAVWSVSAHTWEKPAIY